MARKNIPSNFTFRLDTLDGEPFDRETLTAWLRENVRGFRIETGSRYGAGARVHLARENDAFAFKMRWGTDIAAFKNAQKFSFWDTNSNATIRFLPNPTSGIMWLDIESRGIRE
jgi:hypothetical protein